MEDCIFCKIANGDIPTRSVYEDELVNVFMDTNPEENGHMLVVPKKHISDFTNIDDETLLHIHKVAKMMKEKLDNTLKPDGIRIENNYGCYQVVKHYHLHIIPGYNDRPKIVDIDETYKKIMNK